MGNFQTDWEMNLGKSSMGVEKATGMLRRFKRSGNILEMVTCPVFLTGPGQGHEMYASADNSTLKIQKMLTGVTNSKKEVWVPEEVAEGGLTAKIGTWALLAQKNLSFWRSISRSSVKNCSFI